MRHGLTVETLIDGLEDSEDIARLKRRTSPRSWLALWNRRFSALGLSGDAMQESIIRSMTGSCAKKCCQQVLIWALSGAAMQESTIRSMTDSCAKKCCQQLLIWAQNSPIFSEFRLKMLP
jgi:hypothetical protein